MHRKSVLGAPGMTDIRIIGQKHYFVATAMMDNGVPVELIREQETELFEWASVKRQMRHDFGIMGAILMNVIEISREQFEIYREDQETAKRLAKMAQEGGIKVEQ